MLIAYEKLRGGGFGYNIGGGGGGWRRLAAAA